MKLIMKENEYAERIIEEQDLGSKPFDSLVLVSRYYLDAGYTKKQVRTILNSFIIQCNPTYSVVKWSDTLDNALEKAVNRNAIYIEFISITDKELESISKLNSRQAQRLAFTILCIEKFMLQAYKDKNEYGEPVWIGVQNSDIMNMANVNTSLKRQGLLYKELIDAGMIKLPKSVDAAGVFSQMSKGGTVKIEVTDLRNLGYQYLMYRGEKYFVCSCCGITSKADDDNARKKYKYCKSCARDIYVKQSIESVMRSRSRKVSAE